MGIGDKLTKFFSDIGEIPGQVGDYASEQYQYGVDAAKDTAEYTVDDVTESANNIALAGVATILGLAIPTLLLVFAVIIIIIVYLIRT